MYIYTYYIYETCLYINMCIYSLAKDCFATRVLNIKNIVY